MAHFAISIFSESGVGLKRGVDVTLREWRVKVTKSVVCHCYLGQDNLF